MRLDKFLKVTSLFKRRSVGTEALKEGFISLNGKVAKPSAVVKVGDIIQIDMWNYTKEVKVLQVPTGNSVAKNVLNEYIEILKYSAKETTDD